MIKRCVEALDEDLKEISHEIIVINNGSTDGTKEWLDSRPDIIRIDFENNEGIGYATNRGFDIAKGAYIHYTQGDVLPVIGSITRMYEYMLEYPYIDFLCINAWCSQRDNQEVEPIDLHSQVLMGMGNYAYAYNLFKREILDAGVRMAQDGPFRGPGAGWEESEFANDMWAHGFKTYVHNGPAYFHERRDGQRSGIDDYYQYIQNKDERLRWLVTRWNDINFSVTHYGDPFPERHIRRVAVMGQMSPNLTPADFTAMALRKIGCVADRYHPLQKPEQEYDDYLFVDDGDNQHWTCPEWAHPSKYWALDMHNPRMWPCAPPEAYVEKGRTFDEFYVASQSGLEYCFENGLSASLMPYAASEEIHRHHDEEVVYDWVALWYNVYNRISYANAAMEKFPDGFVGWASNEQYSQYMSRSRCVINLCRIEHYNQRTLETMLTKVPLVTDRVTGLDTLFKENGQFNPQRAQKYVDDAKRAGVKCAATPPPAPAPSPTP